MRKLFLSIVLLGLGSCSCPRNPAVSDDAGSGANGASSSGTLASSGSSATLSSGSVSSSGERSSSGLASSSSGQASSAGCQLTGGQCSTNGDCCSGTCSPGNLCVVPDAGLLCFPQGTECASPVECCTGACLADVQGVYRCDIAVLCGGIGAACEDARDCCGLNCSGGFCSAGLCTQTGDACETANPEACCTGNCDNDSCAQPAGSACTVSGDPCPAEGPSSSCCTKYCVDFEPGSGTDLRCAPAGQCRNQGEPCSHGGQCCSATCGSNGVCDAPPIGGSCLVVGSACQALSDCCSGICANDGTGFKVCQFLGGCRPEEELCRRDSDCCGINSSQVGSNPVCQVFAVDAGVGRCRALSGDAPAGEICEGSRGNTCAPNMDYCDESISGIRRCAAQCDGGAACDETNCKGTGASCVTQEECCSFVCAPSADGGFVCAGGCVADGQACSTHADCCAGFCRLDGVCGRPLVDAGIPPADAGRVDAGGGDAGVGVDAGRVDAGTPDAGFTGCRPISATCASDGQCCDGFCDMTINRCQPFPG